HLLPVYDRPMIYYPIQKMIDAGIKEILIISGPGHAGHFLNLLGSGKEFGVKFTFEIQDEAGGIAQALGLAQDFAENDNVMVILGDNIIQDSIKDHVKSFKSGAKIFLKKVSDPQRFGVATIKKGIIVEIEEKPKKPKSEWAVTGVYIYDNKVYDMIKNLKPSARGELEITDVNNYYIRKGLMQAAFLDGFWSDAGTFESLLRASQLVKENNL
ncbi:MAG: spore coat protein, partial [Nanoarchaeota archaeon]|nr:spore coat protein [Nanoarchaeota archaeon]